jgi:hypothetical protein
MAVQAPPPAPRGGAPSAPPAVVAAPTPEALANSATGSS